MGQLGDYKPRIALTWLKKFEFVTSAPYFFLTLWCHKTLLVQTWFVYFFKCPTCIYQLWVPNGGCRTSMLVNQLLPKVLKGNKLWKWSSHCYLKSRRHLSYIEITKKRNIDLSFSSFWSETYHRFSGIRSLVPEMVWKQKGRKYLIEITFHRKAFHP